ncbi:alpha-1,4-glucan--maltose-1-phosphate maltosyltransferase [Rhodoligotrophos defluvii]|uniref:alpha-1,4-glucan--maltose-1-phosphate maltosyltransferase n=1 Tax=Rhodoligotrophos defluvii TaxID=2561934 RepID=UPI001EF0BC28|nr:alpha-1,4-glucan--maltose-1-phosphate maltosyltransferase [Rhodoligotrophos defluvii]
MQRSGLEVRTGLGMPEAHPGPSAAVSPRIYGLKPALAGPVSGWQRIFRHAAALGFDLVHVDNGAAGNPRGAFALSAAGADLSPNLRGEDARPAADILRALADEAGEHGLGLVLDMALAPEEPAPPGLLESAGEAILAAAAEQAERALDAGAAGFLCRRAHRVPATMWRELIGRIRARTPETLLIADALGVAVETTVATADAGFDFVFNSSAWWDFRQDWALDQYEDFRRRVRTIAFPEDDRTGRLAERFGANPAGTVEQVHLQRYLFALAFSAGLWMPMGYEYGLRAMPADAAAGVATPDAWARCIADRDFDLTGAIMAANALKASLPALQSEQLLRPIAPPDTIPAAYLRFDAESELEAQTAAAVFVNPTDQLLPAPPLSRVLAAGGGWFGNFEDVTPQHSDRAATADPFRPLQPYETRILRGQRLPMFGDRLRDAVPLDILAPQQVAIEAVEPEIDGGRFPVKRVVGDMLEVSADIFADGHDRIDASLFYRAPGEQTWTEVPLQHMGNDRWTGRFLLDRVGRYDYTISGWKDRFGYWQYEVEKKLGAGLDVSLELIEGRNLVTEAMQQATAGDRDALGRLLAISAEADQLEALRSPETAAVMRRAAPRFNLTAYHHTLQVIVERRIAAVAAWYELFPRSQSGDVNRHGTFDDVIARLPYVRDMGFDVLYFPPIHPIGRKNRKGRNNTLTPAPDDPGSPYAIGSEEGGHDALHPELGTFEDFARLIAAAHAHGLEIALDFAIQCSPDHPWIREHPEWFDWRPDGSIKYAENPPKKYEDIVNVHFYGSSSFPSLWYALRDIVLFWVERGVKIFRVDNPHTKPFPFWEWLIREVQDQHPDTIFLAEAFTRPKVMKRLAKLGFTQSYSYFTWRDTKAELTEYLTELTTEGPQDYMRPNFFTNTPDINPYYLQTSGRGGFQARLVLAATLTTVYGIYNGFELCEAAALPGREEYLDSEKYEIRAWDWDRPGNIRADVALVNRIRRENPALWSFANLAFLNCWNDQIIAYYKITAERDNCIVVAVNLDPHDTQSAAFEIPLWAFGLPDHASIDVVDLVTGSRFTWTGKVQSVTLDPAVRSYQIWRLVPPAGLSAVAP